MASGLGDAVGEVRESESRVLAATSEVLASNEELRGVLETFAMVGPFIDLGFETSVAASEIVGIKRYVAEDQDQLGLECWPGDTAVILTAVRVRGVGLWFPSALSYRELRNRLRKAGGQFI